MKRLIGFAAAALLVFAGCTKKNDKLEYGLDINDTLRINLQVEPPSLDWHKSTDTTSAEVQFNIMSGLVEYDTSKPELELKPSLVTKWEASDLAKKWKLTLRSDVKWTDGVAFEAQQVVDGWERLLNPLTASEYAYFLFGVKGARDYNAGKLKDFAQVGVKVVNPTTIEVTLDKSMSFFPMLLTHHSVLPARKDLITKFGDKWTDPANIQTLGPFKLKIWDHDKALVLERNETYWGEKPKVKNVLGYMINDQSTAINLFDAGKIDFLPELPSVELENLKKRPQFRQEGNFTIYYYGMNVKKKPFDDARVRKAFAMAIDKEQIVKLANGGQVPISGWFPKGMFAFDGDVGVKFDPAGAKKLLAEAGYTDVKKVPKVVLGFNTNENHKRFAENVQAQLKANLGVEIEIKSEEWKVYLKSLQADAPHIYRMGWQADYPDPDNFINLMTSYSENNHTNWKNTQFDSLVEEGSRELDSSKRLTVYKEAQKILTEVDTPVIPIYSAASNMLVADRLVDFPINKLARRIYDKVSIKK